MGRRTLLIMDDEADIRAYVATIAEDMGFQAFETGESEEFRRMHEEESPDAVFLDLVMPGVDGVEILQWLADRQSAAAIIVASGMDRKVLETAHRVGETRGLEMLGALGKPILPEDLESLLDQVTPLEQRVTEVSLKQAIDGHDMTVGHQPRAALEKAIDGNEIFLAYQPKIALKPPAERRVVGVEALARWRHPTLGLLPPSQFIPLAEASGLITPLTFLLFDMALAQLTDWQRQGLALGLSVNLAPMLLSEDTLVDRLVDLTRAHDIAPERITIEVTESGAMMNVSRSMATLTRLRLKGFCISMDDFGTGYSSLVELHRMPFTEIKVDRSFVMDLGTSQEADVIVRSTVRLAHSLGLTICAEGVENEAALEALAVMGVDHAQGFLMSRPLQADALPEFARRWPERAQLNETRSALGSWDSGAGSHTS